jgi:soluble lytic murein transglycosylase-like protein
MRVCSIFLLGSTLWAGEYAVLTTGFRIRAERHTTHGETTTLYDRDGGTTMLASSLIASFEVDDYVPPPPPEPAPPVPVAPDVDLLVREAAERHGVAPELVHSVIAAESSYNPIAVSPKGALGLMQLMPGTARDLKVANAFDPAENINGGTAYLRRMLERYSGFRNQLQRALAAYNAGPGKVDLYGGQPPYRETIDFVGRVLRRLNSFRVGRASARAGL